MKSVTVLPLLVMIAAAILLFRGFQHELSRVLVDLATHPDIQDALTQSGEDLRTLARLDPENQGIYRARFDDLQETRQNLEILSQSSPDLLSRYEWFLGFIFAATLILFIVASIYTRRRQDRRLASLEQPLADLAAGSRGLSVNLKGRDMAARMGRMITRAHQLFVRQRNKLSYLENLSGWQEAARRHAHEMRTPLTSIRLEVEGLPRLLKRDTNRQEEVLAQFSAGVIADIGKLVSFTEAFTSFARLGAPRKEPLDLSRFVEDFCRLFAEFRPNLVLEARIHDRASVSADKGMLRQVLVNLCDNSATATGDSGRVVFTVSLEQGLAMIRVQDDGPGIDPKLGERIFEPYVTTSKVGEGMGLGLPISRKIMLEHDGDLALAPTDTGACFLLTLPVSASPEVVAS
ncbi:MAG: HAMP domain-containing sensor histidine kinase [Acidobacteriota bacterium]|nr:HAMP domain-containing sensor histidine kinase [Acidobacteriota bacterium]